MRAKSQVDHRGVHARWKANTVALIILRYIDEGRWKNKLRNMTNIQIRTRIRFELRFIVGERRGERCVRRVETGQCECCIN